MKRFKKMLLHLFPKDVFHFTENGKPKEIHAYKLFGHYFKSIIKDGKEPVQIDYEKLADEYFSEFLGLINGKKN